MHNQPAKWSMLQPRMKLLRSEANCTTLLLETKQCWSTDISCNDNTYCRCNDTYNRPYQKPACRALKLSPVSAASSQTWLTSSGVKSSGLLQLEQRQILQPETGNFNMNNSLTALHLPQVLDCRGWLTPQWGVVGRIPAATWLLRGWWPQAYILLKPSLLTVCSLYPSVSASFLMRSAWPSWYRSSSFMRCGGGWVGGWVGQAAGRQ